MQLRLENFNANSVHDSAPDQLTPPFSSNFGLNSGDYLHVCSGSDPINEVQIKNLPKLETTLRHFLL